MHGAQVAACDYAPAGWPDGTYTIIRRVKISVDKLSADPRSRRRRTVAKDQLALALGGAADYVWAVSFIVTNIPADHGDLVGLEAWFRNRTAIEERFREVKHGGGLNHLPSADPAVNSVWMWAGLLAGALSVMLQSLTGLDTQAHAPGRMRIATLRHQLLNIPGRLIRHARGLTLRLRPADTTLPLHWPDYGLYPHRPDHPAPPRRARTRRHRHQVGGLATSTASPTSHHPRSAPPEQDHRPTGGSRSDGIRTSHPDISRTISGRVHAGEGWTYTGSGQAAALKGSPPRDATMSPCARAGDHGPARAVFTCRSQESNPRPRC